MSTERDWQKEALRARDHIRWLRGELVTRAGVIELGPLAATFFNGEVVKNARERLEIAEHLREVIRWSIREMPDLADRP